MTPTEPSHADWHTDLVTEELPTTPPADNSTLRKRPSTTQTVLVLVFVVLLGLAVVLDRGLTAVGVVALLGTAAGFEPRNAETPPSAYGLPGVADGPSRPSKVPAWVYRAISCTVASVVALLMALEAGASAYLVLAIVAAAAWLVAADGAIRYLRQSRRIERALKSYAPTTAMGYAGRSGAPWQLRMWEPYILRSQERNIVINLHAKYVPLILKGAHLSSPLIQLGSRGFDDLDQVLVPSVKAMFYVQNARSNAEFMARRNVTHVWLNHGDSDKPANFNPRHANYDKLVVCGQAGIDRYERHGIHVGPEKFVILGRPQASDIKSATGPIAEKDPQIVLYAPTWHGLEEAVNFSSLERGPQIVRALIDRGVTVVFRPHPLSYRWRIRKAVVKEIQQILREDRKVSGRKHRWGRKIDRMWTVADCANYSHALISDVSSVVSDFLQSRKPYVMTSMHVSVEEFRAEFSVAETAYVLLGDMSNLDEVLDDLLGEDPLAEARAERKRYVLGEFDGQESADAFAEFVRTLVRGR